MAREVYLATSTMPDTERYGLTAQMRRAAVSVASNIAEGHGRQSRTDYLRFLRMARGSLWELSTQHELATTMKMIPERRETLEIMQETDRVLQGLIRSLEAQC
ncbi:MAG: four helix bundle protein [Phycisphaerales bacterium JB054]